MRRDKPDLLGRRREQLGAGGPTAIDLDTRKRIATLEKAGAEGGTVIQRITTGGGGGGGGLVAHLLDSHTHSNLSGVPFEASAFFYDLATGIWSPRIPWQLKDEDLDTSWTTEKTADADTLIGTIAGSERIHISDDGMALIKPITIGNVNDSPTGTVDPSSLDDEVLLKINHQWADPSTTISGFIIQGLALCDLSWFGGPGTISPNHIGFYLTPVFDMDNPATVNGEQAVAAFGWRQFGDDTGVTIANLTGLRLFMPTVGTYGSITNYRHMHIEDPAVSSAITNLFGLDFDDLTKGSTRNTFIRINGSTGDVRMSCPIIIGADTAPIEQLEVTGGNIGIRDQNALRLYEASSGTNYIGLRANSSRTTNLTYELPTTEPTAGQRLKSAAPSGSVAVTSWTDEIVSVSFVVGDGTNDITTGVKGFIKIDYAATIQSWEIVGDASGSIVIDVWSDSYANFPPTVADTIVGSEKPTLSSAQKNQDTSLTTWTTAHTAGNWLGFNVDSVSGLKRVTLHLNLKKG